MGATAATTPASVPEFRTSRNTAIATGVVLFHVAALWALQSGLIRRAAEVIVPVEILAQIVEPPPPAPAPEAPTGVTTPQPPAPPIAAPVAEAPPAPPAPPAPAKVELPSSSADYLRNPPPAYPAMSRRLGEQGQVMVRVLIGADGNAQQAQIARSSGFERLDKAALDAVLKWRYVPGKRGGVPETMWFNVPINFVLE